MSTKLPLNYNNFTMINSESFVYIWQSMKHQMLVFRRGELFSIMESRGRDN